MGYYLGPYDVKLIGLSGKAGSGKSHFARLTGFIPVALANPFKVDAVVKGGAPLAEVFGKEKSPETRALLQRLGTEEGRDVYGKDVWIKATEALMFFMREHGATRFVVTDVRFRNEAAWVKGLGGKLVRLTGRGGLEGAAGTHVSETELDDYDAWDLVIDNAPQHAEQAVRRFRRWIEALVWHEF